MQEPIEQQTTSMYSDQQECRGMAERLHDSDGVLNDDRIRNAVIENYRRTTATITATTRAVTAATESFRHNANQNYPSLVSAIKGNQERSGQLATDTKVINDNTEAISRARTQYSELYRADQWQSPRDESNYSQQQRSSERISTVQHSVSSQVTKAQQNLLETSEILKKSHPNKRTAKKKERRPNLKMIIVFLGDFKVF